MRQPSVDAAFYREHGYLIIEDLFDLPAVEAILREGTAVCRGERGTVEGLDPVDPADSDADVLARYVTCTHVHKASPMLTALAADDRFGDVAEALIGPNVKSIASQFFIKHAGMPGNAWHQDETFVPTRDRSLCTAWLALDAATEVNGCLRFIPGSHAAGVLWPMRPHNSTQLDRAEEAYAFPGLDRAVSIELRPGSCVFFNGYLLHSSTTNRSPNGGFRRALLYQYTSAETPIAYHPRNVPVSNYADFRDFVMVRGSDPYAWKERVDLPSAFVRRPGPMVEDVVLSDLREEQKVRA